MKNKTSRKAKKFFMVILATALVFGLLMSMPLAVGAVYLNPGTDFGTEELHELPPGVSAQMIAKRTRIGPFMVTHPIGATYVHMGTATPLRVKFEYDADVDTPLIAKRDLNVQWYWNSTNDNTSRSNAIDEGPMIPYDDKISFTETYTPPTSTIGVRYYYAVLSYYDYLGVGEFNLRKMEAATDPAKIEVIPITLATPKPMPTPALTPKPTLAPMPKPTLTPIPTPTVAGKDVLVKKTDEGGKPLAGAVLLLTPQDGKDAQDVADRTYEATSDEDGIAKFTAGMGVYLLSEKKAPYGYEGTDTEYSITINKNGVYLNDTSTQGLKPIPYKTITIVNKPIKIVKPTPMPTATPADATAPGSSPADAPAPGSSSADIDVWKTDANDTTYLSGAVFSLIPDSNYTQDSSVKSYEDVTVNGLAQFTAAPGYYILSEKQAPTGYNASGDKYYIQVEDGVAYLVDPETISSNPYAPVTFNNKKIPKLDDENHLAFMLGYPDGNFRPDSNMTRAEAVVMFSRLLLNVMDLDDYRAPYYPDLDLDTWYANQVCFMYVLGVLTDYSRDTRFRPDDPVTRAEFVTLATHFDDLVFTDEVNFSDVTSSHWANKYINSAAARGWIMGYEDGTFKPDDNITRVEVVTLVGRMLDRYADQDYIIANIDSLPRNYLDISMDYWGYSYVMEASISHDYTKDANGEHWTSAY